MTPSPQEIEAVARILERAIFPYWTDEQFEVWWNKDPRFCEKVNSWAYFTGTAKQKRLWEAQAAIRALDQVRGKNDE